MFNIFRGDIMKNEIADDNFFTIEKLGCDGCFFKTEILNKVCGCEIPCSSFKRKDKKSVIFVKKSKK